MSEPVNIYWVGLATFKLSSTDSMAMAQKFWGLTPLFTVIVYQPEVQAKMFWLSHLADIYRSNCPNGLFYDWFYTLNLSINFHKCTRCSNSSDESTVQKSQKVLSNFACKILVRSWPSNPPRPRTLSHLCTHLCCCVAEAVLLELATSTAPEAPCHLSVNRHNVPYLRET